MWTLAQWVSVYLLATTVVAAQTNVSVAAEVVSPGEIASDKVAFAYPKSDKSDVLLVGNDGAATGGFGVFTVATNTTSTLPSWSFHATGRTKLVGVVYSLADKDRIVTLSQSDSYLRFFDSETETETEDARTKVWGDYSAMCGWRSAKTGAQYLYIFGKKQVKIFLVRGNDDHLEVLEVQTAAVPIEAEGCTVSQKTETVLFAGSDGNVYAFPADDSTNSPTVRVLLPGSEEIAGLSSYYGANEEYLLVLFEDSVTVFNSAYRPVTAIGLDGLEDFELSDVGLYQGSLGSIFPAGALAFAIESDDVTGFALASLEGVLSDGELDTGFTPRRFISNATLSTCEELSDCNGAGFCTSSGNATACQCFSGFTGDMCSDYTCKCTHGECIGPNVCGCDKGWAGPTCSFRLATPKYETQENGEDGDDPSIWISPKSANLSRIITTTKSKEGAGFAVFDLTGKRLQHFPAGEPNNVDVIYGFPLGDRVVDLIYAACRDDNTLCFAEVTASGTLVEVPGSGHPAPEGYDVYGSCAYHSSISGKFYLFVNAKDATYLQYELSSSVEGALSFTLIRSFRGGSGGQVEGCVVDEPNGWLILGEEPYGLWRYPAEPPAGHELGGEDATALGHLIDSVDSGQMFADVEGVTLVYGANSSAGLILVSCQGMSAYNVYLRAPPHEFVGHFTIGASKDGKVDHVTNTDGIAAVGTALNADFPHGLVVVHDDVNEAPDGTVTEEAAFKLVSLADVVDARWLRQAYAHWNPHV